MFFWIAAAALASTALLILVHLVRAVDRPADDGPEKHVGRPRSSGETRVVCFGDSHTHGRAGADWVSLLRERMGPDGYLFINAGVQCAGGQCSMGPCLPGFVDLDGDPATGCEYACLPSNDGVELCDALDNDCDGATDEEMIRECGVDEGACARGTETCAGGQWGACVGAIDDAFALFQDGRLSDSQLLDALHGCVPSVCDFVFPLR